MEKIKEKINQYDINGKKTGYWEILDPIFKGFKSKGNYIDGKKDGEWLYYGDSNKICAKKSFKNGEYHGLMEAFYDNGNLHLKVKYNEGKVDGLWEYYKENGELWGKM